MSEEKIIGEQELDHVAGGGYTPPAPTERGMLLCCPVCGKVLGATPSETGRVYVCPACGRRYRLVNSQLTEVNG